MILYNKGYVFQNPEGPEFFVMTRDVEDGDLIVASDFEPGGGAPEPTEHEIMPSWLADQLFA